MDGKLDDASKLSRWMIVKRLKDCRAIKIPDAFLALIHARE
jgi:hypothetical protein